jgi:hypothetical protein
MTIVPVTKGKIALSKDMLDHLQINADDAVSIDLLPGGKVELTAPASKTHLANFIGALHDPGNPTLSLEEIKKITEDAWAGKR